MSDEDVIDCGNEFPAHYKVMLDKLNEQRQLDQFTDITLIVDGHQFRAHKAVLAACSQFFHKFFQDFKLEPLVEIEGVSNSAFRHLMEFTYTAKLAVSGPEEVSDVWKAAEYLQMQEAIKALNNRMAEGSSYGAAAGLTGKSKAKKRKIAETSNVITETLPSVETEPVEIEVEIAEGPMVVEEAGLEEVVEAAKNAHGSGDSSDDSALALLADITSKYQQGEPALHVVKKGGEVVLQEDGVVASKALESIEVVEVQISQLDNMFRCDKCERSFKLFYHLKQHMRVHAASSDKPYVCRHCSKAYAREGALKQHLNSYHFDAEEQSRRQRPQKRLHVCEYCDKQFDHFGHFKEHLRKHTGEKPFECPDCHERFARNSTLKCHMAACQNGCGAKKGRKKLYECQVCSSVFNSWDQFKDHLVIHTGEKPNHCTLCDLWFTQPRDLRTHLRDLHGVQEKVVVTEEVVIAEPAAAGPAPGGEEEEEEAASLLHDGMRVEHVTVEPVPLEGEAVDVVGVEEAVVVQEEEVEVGRMQAPQDEEEEEGLKFSVEALGAGADDGAQVEIQVEQVTGGTAEHAAPDSEVHLEQEQVEIQVEEGEVQSVEV
ncbi:zinc finger protein 131 isoform X1 [Megalops cyprinoides]|uniref:zinc finger protein 131 isoform X1 n=1 Tax=Megalops cyprinoides TaxID=118141 RepID=UPI001865681E|nr:zinc finger protein 131 isoform X1 [Megalops cyprinoides]